MGIAMAMAIAVAVAMAMATAMALAVERREHPWRGRPPRKSVRLLKIENLKVCLFLGLLDRQNWMWLEILHWNMV